MKSAIIFDFDGVLCNTFEFHRNKIIEFSGKNLDKETYRDIHNSNFFENNKNFHLADVDWRKYRDFVTNDQINLSVEEETRKALLELNKIYSLFVVTSGGNNTILRFLENNKLNQIFEQVFGLEDSPSKIEKFKMIFEKYGFSNENSVFITDTLGDLLEANELSIPTIAVDFGFHDRGRLEKGNPRMIVSEFSKIPESVKEILTD